jgi:hypothetical protein
MSDASTPKRSDRYRQKAAEFRARADTVITQDMRAFFLLLAQDFDRIAEEAETAEGDRD